MARLLCQKSYARRQWGFRGGNAGRPRGQYYQIYYGRKYGELQQIRYRRMLSGRIPELILEI